MAKTSHKTVKRQRRHARVRSRVSGTADRPRLSVYKSNTQIIAQVIDDEGGVTLAATASKAHKGATPRARAEEAAKELAKAVKAKGVTKIVFDRGGSEYTGTIQAFADAARSAGLEF
ncbi:MAG: 50S ribosomal protein L18 [Patescibacteria group bacterium]